MTPALNIATPDRAWFAEVNRTRLRVWEWGDPDAPPIICAHGAQDHGRMWDGLAPRLAGLGYRVLAPDLRGHGDSGRISTGHVWNASALDLGLLARSVADTVGLVGHSFGSGQLMWVAALWPDLVRWTVSLDGLGPPPAAFAERDLAEMTVAALDAGERALFAPPRTYPDRAEMVDRRARANPRLPRPWVEHLVEHGSIETEGGWTWKHDRMFNIGLPSGFSIDHLNAEHALVRCPVLALTGAEHDTWSELAPADVAQRLSFIPDVRHREVEGAGHYLHIEQPDAVFAMVAEFLADVGP